jgi:hypothetical protein
MAETKLTKAKIPNMKGKPEKKLGLLTSKNKRMVTFRMSNETLKILNDMVESKRNTLFHEISKTCIIEAAIMHLSTLSDKKFKTICAEYGSKKDL